MLSLALVLVADYTPASLDSSSDSYIPSNSALRFVDLSSKSFTRKSQNLIALALEFVRTECEPQNGFN